MIHGARQLRWLSVHATLTYPFACVPFLYFHFRSRGVSIIEYADTVSAYYAAMVVAEVPTGLLADRLGRKPALVAGPLLLAAGFGLLAQGRTLLAFCIGQAVIGLGHSIISGPPSALLFETLRGLGRQSELLRLESRMHALRLAGTAAAFLLGGAIAWRWGIEASIWATVGLHVAASASALALQEAAPPAHGTPSLAAILATARADLRKPDLLWLAGYFTLLFFLLRYCFHTYQPLLERAGRDQPLLLGPLYAALNLVAVPFARLGAPALERFGARAVFVGMPWLLGFSLLAMAWAPWWLALALLALHQVPLGMHWGLVQSYANQRLAPGSRATLLSAMSLLARLAFATLFPLVCLLHEHRGLAAAYSAVGVAGVLLGWWQTRRRP